MALKWLLVFARCIFDSLAWIIELFVPTQRKRLPPIKDALLLKSASEIASLIKSRKVSCEQVITAYIDRIKECEPLVNALVDNRFADALEEAKTIDRALEQGQQVQGSLVGVPFTGKDSHSVKGLAWTAGLVAKRGTKGTEDAPVVSNLKAAGAICLGVTNAPELAFWWDSSNKLYGTTNNPYDLSRIPGGSTGGNASLISYAGSLFGNASDIGGSIRMPSAFCGIYGHKTSPGIVNTGGHYPTISDYRQQFLSFGPLCRYVSDIRPVLTAMAGGDSVIEEKLPRFNEPIDWSQIKIYYQLDGGDPFCTRTKQYIRDAIVRAANHFHDKFKSTVEQVTFAEFEEAFDLFMENFKDPTITPLASALVDGKGEISIMRELALSLIGKSNVTLPSIFVSLLEKMTPSSPSPEHVTKYKQLKSKFNSMLGDNSIFLYPVHPQVAPKHKTTLLRVNNAVGYCGLFNLLATPVTTCPLGLNDEGLPMSVQIVASPNMDHLTIEAASELDSVFGGWRPPSPVELAAS